MIKAIWYWILRSITRTRAYQLGETFFNAYVQRDELKEKAKRRYERFLEDSQINRLKQETAFLSQQPDVPLTQIRWSNRMAGASVQGVDRIKEPLQRAEGWVLQEQPYSWAQVIGMGLILLFFGSFFLLAVVQLFQQIFSSGLFGIFTAIVVRNLIIIAFLLLVIGMMIMGLFQLTRAARSYGVTELILSTWP